jgi:hypothetical protein
MKKSCSTKKHAFGQVLTFPDPFSFLGKLNGSGVVQPQSLRSSAKAGEGGSVVLQ